MDRESCERADAFPATHWATVFLAGRPEETAGWEALGRLLKKYQRPLLAHLRWRFHVDEDQAQDWFQSFVEKKILERHLLRNVRQEGCRRFRSFVCEALDNFVKDKIRYDNRECRKPKGGFVSLGELAEEEGEEIQAAPITTADPLDVAWAREVVALAETTLHQTYKAKGRNDLWGVFHDGFVQPARNETDPPSMSELAQRFGFQSATEASNRLGTSKKAFGQSLKSVVSEYVKDPEDQAEVEAEIRDLMAILSDSV